MLRVLRAFLCVALVHLAVTVSFALAAAPVVWKGKPALVNAAVGHHAGLARRSHARRRQERRHLARAVLRAAVPMAPHQPAFRLAAAPDFPPLVASAPPDHPPA